MRKREGRKQVDLVPREFKFDGGEGAWIEGEEKEEMRVRGTLDKRCRYI
jgi:hypothetical protein